MCNSRMHIHLRTEFLPGSVLGTRDALLWKHTPGLNLMEHLGWRESEEGMQGVLGGLIQPTCRPQVSG